MANLDPALLRAFTKGTLIVLFASFIRATCSDLLGLNVPVNAPKTVFARSVTTPGISPPAAVPTSKFSDVFVVVSSKSFTTASTLEVSTVGAFTSSIFVGAFIAPLLAASTIKSCCVF